MVIRSLLEVAGFALLFVFFLIVWPPAALLFAAALLIVASRMNIGGASRDEKAAKK